MGDGSAFPDKTTSCCLMIVLEGLLMVVIFDIS